MIKNTFRLSTIVVALLTATSAHSALYQIVEVNLEGQGNEAYGVAVTEIDSIENCFETTCTSSDVQTGNEIRNGTDGFPFKDEAPLAYDNRFHILNQKDLEYYCDRERGYNSCENWAISQWYGSNGFGGLRREREAYYEGYYANAKGFVDMTEQMTAPLRSSAVNESAPFLSGTNNVVITNFTSGKNVIGTTSSGYYSLGTTYGFGYRERGFVDNTLLLPNQNGGMSEKMGRSMAFDSFDLDGVTYVIGSASVSDFAQGDSNKDYGGDLDNCPSASYPGELRECHHFAFATKPYIWSLEGAGESVTGSPIADWAHGESGGSRNDYTALASARGAAIPTVGSYVGKPVLAGYNVVRPDGDNNYGMQAGIYYPNDAFSLAAVDSVVPSNQWTFKSIANATIYDGGENAYIYSNSRTTGISENMIAVGESKLRYNRALNGALANRLFWADANSSTPTANYFLDGVFFSGAGGKANAINNFNEVVGQVDAENAREDGGKQRRKRGFIYPLGDINGLATAETAAKIEARSTILKNKSWWIDDLTNGGSFSDANNAYRIIEAGSINDAGVISATAIKCVGGYDTNAHNSYCGGGTQTEKVVAVTLIPITGATSADIVERSADVAPVVRQGAGLGAWLIGLFGIYIFRKRH
ncbi:DUF3466 family protein [Vibrio ulleungensis]|uniref:DUF3466 family protein n=1 Tax=Vibrio ulleungensis TaxID=2807619 RepID=A0ABS2HI69_9VIBR|nr:DUF3466 family protein [Vibrio ulleungensis]MBM7035792.1 DUF3466 family protein [Vibrio ulleungensis]